MSSITCKPGGYMMKLIALPFLLLCSCIGNRFGSKGHVLPVKASQQFLYSYASEGTGYSDIQMMYNADSTAKAKPFFDRPSLQTTEVKIHCQVRKTIVSVDGDRMLVCFEIIQPELQIDNNFMPVDAGIISREIVLPVFAEMSGSGSILSVKADTAVSYLSAGIVKNILSNTQAVIPGNEKETWQVSEDDINGTFNAGYEKTSTNAKAPEYDKVNLGYTTIKSAKLGQRFLPDNKTTITTNSRGIVQRISISESLMTMFGADTIVASGSSMEFQLLSAMTVDDQTRVVFENLEQSKNYSKATALSDPISDEDINRMVYRNTLANDNFETLLEKLKLVPVQDKKYEGELIKQFRALAWLSEPGCTQMAALLEQATPGSDTFRVISSALAGVETSFSIDELAGVIASRRNEESVVIQLLPILATSHTPTGIAADVVQELAFGNIKNDFIRSTAQLTLGGMVKNLSSLHRKKADELTDMIVDKMKNYTDTLQQLLVYGNTGSYRLVPVYAAYINDPKVSEEIRKVAVFAMRLIDNSEVSPMLQQLLTNQDTVLSKAANETMRFREQFFHQKY